MDVQCEQRKCGKTLDMREAVFCHRCQKYFCDDDYEQFHSDHDELQEQEPKWAVRLQE